MGNYQAKSEVELLKVTTNVVGMAKLLEWRHLETIGNIRKGFVFTRQMVKDSRPKEKSFTTPTVFIEKQVSVPKKSTSKTTAQKRKIESNHTRGINGSASKRAKSSKNESVTTRSVPVVEIRPQPTRSAPEQELSNSAEGTSVIPQKPLRRSSRIHELGSNLSIGGKRTLSEGSEVYDRVKRLQLASNHGGASTVHAGLAATSHRNDQNQLGMNATPDVYNAGITASAETPGFKIIKVKHAVIRDRQQAAVAITPFGRPIYKFNCGLELIIGLRDAIKAHMSLLNDAKILHRDISVNNIIFIDPGETTMYGGRLIDLDLATLFKDGKEQGNKGVITGTTQFMALETLKGSCSSIGVVVSHKYRHDLESFYYVLVWICIRCGWADDDSPYEGLLSTWYTGTAEQIFSEKEKHLQKYFFKDQLLPMFSPMFEDIKPLVSEFWNKLFYKNNEFIIDNNMDDKELYEPIIDAFDETTQIMER
ncbi:BgTH12-05639 [Blumeria graminis f. sp. triticale]|uniref:non-specific serine/threonine protein kinase n=1 Tax=Blumeria graminis f. sp. triticale TaxID=1689686 RepID=A0A9W4D9P7_BLUGR|nr:BgTH12-05639 [Blumeria graminis f. sp. triticale]